MVYVFRQFSSRIFQSMIKEYDLDYNSFVGGWYIPEKVCDELIDFYNSRENSWKDGLHEIKKCTEIFIEPSEFNVLNNYLPLLSSIMDEYKLRYPLSNHVTPFGIRQNIKIQHYKPGEGFYGWHCENHGSGENGKRHLVFMTYLNTLDNAGTEFYHQKITTPCEKGLTIIWPAGWTHTHRGVVNNNSDKYIITGWYSFNDE